MSASDRAPPADRVAPLFGRGEIHDAVVQTLEEARQGAGQFLLLVGHGGVGKSTLLQQTVLDAQTHGFLAVSGRALPSDLPQPFALVQDLLRSLAEARAIPEGSTAEDPTFLSLFLAPFDTDSRVGGDPLGGPNAAQSEADHLLTYLAGPSARVEESRIVLFDRLTDFFLELTKHDPVLLAIDDLHFADDSSIEFLEKLSRAIGSARLALVATVSPAEEAPSRTAHLIERLLTGERATRLTVREMTEPEVAEYARWLLKGRDPGREAVMRWYTQTEGNPLFVEYVVRGAMGLAGSGPAQAQDLDEILHARVRALPEGDRRVLVYATVLGKEFDFPTLAVAAGGHDEERLAESVDRLVHGSLFREKGGEVYEFVSERIRAEAYAQLTETRRRILHRKVARALEARGRPDPATVFELARQFYLAREDAPAIEYNRRAAELASRTYAHDTAVVHLERALECARRSPKPDVGIELRIMVELGRVLVGSEEFRRSEEVLHSAVERARSAPGLESELALALLWLAKTRSEVGEFSSAKTLATEAYDILARQGNPRGLLVAHRVLGIACWRVGEFAEAERHQREEIAIAEGENDSWEHGHALIDLANTLVSQGRERIHEALELYEQASALFSDGRDFTAQARVHMNEALLYHSAGEFDRGFASLQAAIEAAERSHSRLWIGYCRMNESQFNVEAGRTGAARASLTRARTMLEPLGDQFAHQQLTMIDGMISEADGEFSAAEAAFGEALRLARDLHFEAEVAESEFRRARLALHQGHREAARERLDSAKRAGLYTLKGDLVREAEELEKAIAAPPDPAA